MCAHHAGEFPERDQALALFVGEHFVVNEADMLFQYGLQEFAVVGLLFDGMGKEEVGFVGDEQGGRDLFHAEDDVAVTEVFAQA